MKASGNGSPEVCANNLLRMVRGECPYERVKGIDPRIVDSPVNSATDDLKIDAQWLVETYEPRAILESIDVKPGNPAGGDFSLIAILEEKEE